MADAPDHAIDEEAASITRQIGSRIVELRQRKGWTQKDFAEALNSTVQWVSLVETGRQNLTIHTLVRLAIKLGVAPRLLWESPAPPRRRPAASRGRPRKPPSAD